MNAITMLTLANSLAGLLSVVLSILFVRDLLARRARRLKSLPPGPPGLPIIGNLLDLPSKVEWEVYTKWAKEYGKIVYLENVGQPILVINSLDVATELFERRSSTYSDRPGMVMINKMLGMEWGFAFMPYGDCWRQHRKIFHLEHHPKAVERFFPAQQTAVLRLAQSLLESPERYLDHLLFFGAYVILNMTYGYRPKDIDDPFVRLNVASLGFYNDNGHQTFLIERFPFLSRLPSWFPGAHFKKTSLKAIKTNRDLVDQPFERAKELIMQGNPDPSFAQERLANLEEKRGMYPDNMEEMIKNSAAISYFAGGETTTSSITYFFLAMILYPEVQKKAQAELDKLLQGKRLPDFNDMRDLPYIPAVVSEVLRWRPVAPTGLPHRAVKEDIYDGYRIPEGTVLVGNIWGILHDEQIYGKDHEEFIPDRFLPKEGRPVPPDPSVAVFGFGRRVCPGRYLALNNLWLTIATILVTFDLRKPLDEAGNEMEPSLEQISGIIVHAVPFDCRFIPRSDAARKLVQQTIQV